MNLLSKLKSSASINLNLPNLYSQKSWAQEGEDLIINKYFNGKKEGFYVDVGAHHPFRYSNTFLPYQNGWRGINIDPTPGFKAMFDQTRLKDINLEIGITSKPGSFSLYQFSDSALNTTNKKRADEVVKSGQSQLVKSTQIKTVPLASILEKYLSKDKTLDLLSIDTEGNELDILKSNNWSKYRPEMIIVEIMDSNIFKSSIYRYLTQKGYQLYAKTSLNCLFVKKKDE